MSQPLPGQPKRARRDDELRPPGDGGDEPDLRFTFANERTFRARNRTALALVAAGPAAAASVHEQRRGSELRTVTLASASCASVALAPSTLG